jgi:hypothetical protein
MREKKKTDYFVDRRRERKKKNKGEDKDKKEKGKNKSKCFRLKGDKPRLCRNKELKKPR